ncbi:hypothetical protein [Pelobacter propionicus]|uniref:Uncharacterized protein n=1 Tax=Pelobacter propionicus (strain DSM 2379 / NBRC 103807 / OttBd1) TaxID=338966 RepID=A1AQ01_PELPD|nr:hypothetical protein [Pelobacter propionicus]ABK99421.1 conserved hypothetical protein [Pelobacter propionicus DSM 2379]
MAETETTQRRPGYLRTLLLRGFMLLLCLAAVAVLALKIYLNSSHAPRLLSAILTDYLHQTVRVATLRTDGDVLSLTAVTLANPPDAPPGNLCRVERITVAPDWGELLRGRRSLRLLSLSGLRVDLRRNSTGVWNFSRLQRLLGTRKPSGAELLVRRFVVRDGALTIDGQGVRGLNLLLTELTTKGTSDARIQLSFQDPGRNRYTLIGKLRPGNEPELDLNLSAPAISPAALAGMFAVKDASLLKKTRAALRMNVLMHAGRLRLRGSLDVRQLPLALVTKQHPTIRPLNGKLEFIASYDTTQDQARLKSLTLTLNDRLVARASATMEEVRSAQRFSVDLDIARLDLARLGFLLPEGEQGRTFLAGTIAGNNIHLAGNASGGVSAASGTFLLRDASLRRDSRLLFGGVSTPLSLSRVVSGYEVRGRFISRRGRDVGSLLETLEAPFRIILSNRFRLSSVHIPELTASIMGLSVSGRMGLEPAAATPLSASLRVIAPSLARIAPLAETLGLRVASGRGSLSLYATGRGVGDFSARATARLSNLRGTRTTHDFALADGLLDARLVRNRGGFGVSGTGRLSGMGLDGRKGDGSFAYDVSDATLRLRDATLRTDGTTLTIARAAMKLPAREASGKTMRYPLSAKISGGVIRQGDAVLDGFSATVRANLVSVSSARWLEGEGELGAGYISWQGKQVGSPRLHLALSRSGARGDLGGTLLGGTLDGSLSLDPFALDRGGAFRLGIRKGQMAMIGNLLPKKGIGILSAGTLDGTCAGGYSRADGLTFRFESAGKDIATSDGKKTLFSNAGYQLSGSLSRDRLRVTTARATVGSGVMISATADIATPLSSRREGRISFDLPATPCTDIIDPFVNMLPRLIQEASVEGSLASHGQLILRGDSKLLEGSLRMEKLLLDLPSQNIRVADISGTLPFSLDLSGTTSAETGKSATFSRQQYPRIMEKLRATAADGQVVTVGGVSFGPLSLGETRLTVSAADGVTRITSLRSSLYEGALLGTGSIMLRDGISYRADLLINGLSLKLLCASIPAIKDYISGRVDGLVSLGNVGRGVAGLVGFSELWAREGNGEKMLVSRVFLQKLSGKNLSGFFFRNDRPFDQAEIAADLEGGYLTFETLDISHTNIFGVRDLSVTIAPSQNRIALDHLFNSIRQAASRGKAAAGTAGTKEEQQPAAAEPEFTWDE